MYAGIPKGETAASHVHQPYLTTEVSVGRNLSIAYTPRWEVLFLKSNCIIIKDNDRNHTKLGDTFNLPLKKVYRFTLKASLEIFPAQVIRL